MKNLLTLLFLCGNFIFAEMVFGGPITITPNTYLVATNGIYDVGEPFVDALNGVWDEGEVFADVGNGVYDEGEEFTDFIPMLSLASYNSLVAEKEAALVAKVNAEAERDAKLTLDEIKDLRAGSTMIEIQNGQATLTMEVEESDDLGVWTNGSATSIQIPIDAEAGKKFFRFKMAE